MQRINIKELTNINETIIEDGTSAKYLACNPYNGKYGILKENGCMLGIDNEDLRERLASQILNLCGVNAANIELMIDDEGNHYCFSYNVLKENEEHIQLPTVIINENMNKEEIFKNYMNDLFDSIAILPNISEQQYIEIKNRLLQIIFMDLIIDHYDRKMDNCKIIYDTISKEYKAPIAYDYGTAFSKDSIQTNGIHFFCTNEEVMTFMLKYYYEDLESTINSVFSILTDENIELLLSNEIYKPLNPELISSELKHRIKQLQELIFNLQNENDLKM